ncbi:SH3 domain-containing protein [Enterovirga sp. CN4-39]|uniref:SH3 domain-containing protein n=1 Tax=Enterovirga sp. CN4-39 TaxID=3400910 RepID=UPI003C0F86DE
MARYRSVGHAALFALLLTTLPASMAPVRAAAEGPVGKVSGLPVPRYVSLKTDRVNLREGPSKDHRTAWVFQRAGLPVEITAEFEVWRRIRDAAGTEGWVLHSLLSGRRTALVMPWAKAGTEALPLFERQDEKSNVVAQLQPNVITSVRACREGWCRVTIAQPGRDISGFIRQDRLWGVYPNETID